MSMTSSSNRSTHFRRIAYAVNSDLSGALGQLEEAARTFPEHQSELNQMTYDIDRMQRRLKEMDEGVQ